MSINGPSYAGLLRERVATINSMQLMLDDALEHANDWPVEQFDARLDALEGYWHRFQVAQQRLVMEYAHLPIVSDSLMHEESSTLQLYANVKALLNKGKATVLAAAEPPRRIPRPSEIKVSPFSGSYTEWAAWRSEFQAKVLDTRMDAADKITLLLGALTKEASQCAGRAERLDEVELNRIWAKLDKTYDNTYQQVYAHIAQIINIPPMNHASADKIRSMIDTVDQHLRMLQRFDMATQHWGPVICVLLLSKLDVVTRNAWESKETLPNVPDLQALFMFLEQRILAIRNIEQNTQRFGQVATSHIDGKSHKASSDNKRYHPNKQSQDKRNHSDGQAKVKSVLPDCFQCGAGVQHYLWRCNAFRALTSTEQLEQLKKWGVCEVCLKDKHKATECTKGACPICKDGRHNSLLCPKADKKTDKKANHQTRGGESQPHKEKKK